MCRAGLNERETPGKVATARPPKRLVQLHIVCFTCPRFNFVEALLKTSKLIRFGSLHFRDNWGDRVQRFLFG